MSKPLQLVNGSHWRTRSAAQIPFKQMLNSYKNGQKVENPGHHSDLAALLVYYDSLIESDTPPKIGAGISHFERQSNIVLGYPTNGFWVHRTDGTKVDFSYIDAVNGKSR